MPGVNFSESDTGTIFSINVLPYLLGFLPAIAYTCVMFFRSLVVSVLVLSYFVSFAQGNSSLKELAADKAVRSGVANTYEKINNLKTISDEVKQILASILHSIHAPHYSLLNLSSPISKNSIESLLANRKEIQDGLIYKIHSHDMQIIRELISEKKGADTFDLNKAYLASFLARYMVNLYGGNAGAGTAAWNAISVDKSINKSVDRDFAWRSAREATWGSSLGSVVDAAGEAFASLNVVQDVFDRYANATHQAASDAAWTFTFEVLQTLKLTRLREIGEKAYAVSELFVMNWMIQNNAEYFIKAFNAAYEKLDGSMTIKQVNVIINQHVGESELAGNPFIVELKQFLAKTEALVRAE